MVERDPAPGDGVRSRRIGFLIDRWEPRRGGAEQALALLASYLEARGHHVLAFATQAAPDAPGEFRRVRSGPPLGSLWRTGFERALGPALVHAARAAKCDVTIGLRHLPEVDVYWPHGGGHLPSWQARYRVTRQGAAAGDVPAPSGRHVVFLDYERQLLTEGGARRVVCVSELVRRELMEQYPACAGRLVVVPNGIDLDAFHPRLRDGVGAELRRLLGIGERELLLVLAARDPRLKGLPQLFAALATLPKRPWKLAVAGPRHPRRWVRAAVRAGLAEERVSVHEELPSPALFAAADLTVMPTWRDTSSLVVLESLASGTPVITTRCAGAADVMTDPAAGTVLDDPGDVAALREAVDDWCGRLASGAVVRNAVRGAARNSVRHLGLAPWLEAMERIVLEAAAR